MTLREFCSRCWYVQPIVIVEYGKYDPRRGDPESQAIAKGTPHEFRSVVYEELKKRTVKSYGVINNNLIVEVE